MVYIGNGYSGPCVYTKRDIYIYLFISSFIYFIHLCIYLFVVLYIYINSEPQKK